MDRARIDAEIDQTRKLFDHAVAEGACQCRSCMDQLRSLHKSTMNTLGLLADLAGEHFDQINDLITLSQVNGLAVAALGARLEALERQQGENS